MQIDIEKVLKKNKIKKQEFAARCGYKTRDSLRYALKRNTMPLEDILRIMLLERTGINIDELIKSKL